MKNLFFAILFFIYPTWGTSQSKQQIWTDADRLFLISGLKNSQLNILNEVKGLTNDQLHFKPDSNKWSIAEVLEHVSVYEELLYWDLSNNQYTEERHDLVRAFQDLDSAMTAYATDPNKGQSPFATQPIGRFKDREGLILFFSRYRNEVIKLIQETKTDFRLHFIFRPADWGIWHIRDLHQYTLLWIAHTERHLNQIKKNKTHPAYPN